MRYLKNLMSSVVWFYYENTNISICKSFLTYFRQHDKNIVFKNTIFSEEFHTIHIDLKKNIDQLNDDLSRSTRYDVNRSFRIGIQVQKFNSRSIEIEKFLSIHKEFNIYKKLGKPLIWKVISNYDWVLYKASNNLDWICYSLVIRQKSRVRLWVHIKNWKITSNSVVGYASKRLIWEGILSAKNEEYLIYDMGGIETRSTNLGKGITRFKESFGGVKIVEKNSIVARNFVFKIIFQILLRANIYGK